MAIFRTSNGRGWGVKTLVDIRRNTFVMEYVGEVSLLYALLYYCAITTN